MKGTASTRDSSTFSCIVPFYNEGRRVLSVLKVVSSLSDLKEVIAVDDGSTDNSSFLIREYFPSVRLTKLMKHRGKSAAVLKGLALARGYYIFLIDADLERVKREELEAAITTVRNTPSIDMLVLRRREDPLLRYFSLDIAVAGERILKKPDLEQALKHQPQGYQLEVAINQYMMEHKKQSFWMKSSTINHNKLKKLGILEGLKAEFKMDLEVLNYTGVVPLMKQVFYLSQHQLDNLQHT